MMAGKTMIFEPETVVRYFKREEFERIPTEKLHNIIINIFPYETEILAMVMLILFAAFALGVIRLLG